MSDRGVAARDPREQRARLRREIADIGAIRSRRGHHRRRRGLRRSIPQHRGARSRDGDDAVAAREPPGGRARDREDRRGYRRPMRSMRRADRCRTPRGDPLGGALHRLQTGRARRVTAERCARSYRGSALSVRLLGRGRRAGRRRIRRRRVRHAGPHGASRRRAVGAGAGRARARPARRHRRGLSGAPGRARARARHRSSAGKDTTTGHWEMMGIRLEGPFPLYPDGFPPEVIEPFGERSGDGCWATYRRRGPRSSPSSARSICARASRSCTRAATRCSRSRRTSMWCRSPRSTTGARSRAGLSRDRISWAGSSRGRSKASPGAFVRRPERRDYAVPPPAPTVLDALSRPG